MNEFSGYNKYVSRDFHQPVDNLDYVYDERLPDALPSLDLNTDQIVDNQQVEALLTSLHHLLSLLPVFKPPLLLSSSPLSGNSQVNKQINEILRMHPEIEKSKDKVDASSQTVNLPAEIPYPQTCYYSIPPNQ